MPLNANVMGTALYEKSKEWNDKDIPAEDIEAQRLAFWQGVASVIIDHFKTNANLQVPGLGLTAPNGAVGGTSITGKIL